MNKKTKGTGKMPTSKTKPADLAGMVIDTLATWHKWRGEAEQSGHVTPVQALAVLLWARENDGSGDQLGKHQAHEFVNAWLAAISRATALRGGNLHSKPFRLLVPRDPLTRLELEPVKGVQAGRESMPPDGWVIQWQELDTWLSAADQGTPFKAFFEAATAEAGKAEAWDGERLSKRRSELTNQGIRAPMATLSKETGIPERTIRDRIKKHEDEGKAMGPYRELVRAK